jgi:transcriptional regulator with XRE-family HTH domain
VDFAEQVYDWRIESRLSQREVARRAGLDFGYLSRIEAKLADWDGVSPETIPDGGLGAARASSRQ